MTIKEFHESTIKKFGEILPELNALDNGQRILFVANMVREGPEYVLILTAICMHGLSESLPSTPGDLRLYVTTKSVLEFFKFYEVAIAGPQIRKGDSSVN